MKKQLKSLAASAALAVGLSASANAVQEENVQGQYVRSLVMSFELAACTNDNHTVYGGMMIYASKPGHYLTKTRSELQSELQTYADKAWKEIVSPYSSDYFPLPNQTPDMRKKFNTTAMQALENMAENYEKNTGISIQSRTGAGDIVPGCKAP